MQQRRFAAAVPPRHGRSIVISRAAGFEAAAHFQT